MSEVNEAKGIVVYSTASIALASVALGYRSISEVMRTLPTGSEVMRRRFVKRNAARLLAYVAASGMPRSYFSAPSLAGGYAALYKYPKADRTISILSALSANERGTHA